MAIFACLVSFIVHELRPFLTDLVFEELCLVQTRKSSMSTKMHIMVVRKLPSVCKKQMNG